MVKMDVVEGSSASAQPVEQIIQAGHTILLRLPSGEIRTMKLEKDSYVNLLPRSTYILPPVRNVGLGKFGSFRSDELVGQPYGLTYTIVEKSLKVVAPRPIQEVGMQASFYECRVFDSFTEDTDATNELINDGESVQPLTLEEIEQLKKSGLPAEVRLEQFSSGYILN